MHKHARSTAAPRFPARLTLAALVFAGALLLGGTACAHGRAVLYEGVHLGALSRLTRVSDSEADREAQQVRTSWRQRLEGRGRSSLTERFANLAPAELRRRLATLAARYDFTITDL